MGKDYSQALHEFWSGFGWKAYDSATVPSGDLSPQMPRITYDVAMAEFGEQVSMSASVWDKSYSWESVSKKADEIYERIGLGGKLLSYDDGYIWIKRGTPFAQRMADEDDAIRRVYLNVDAEYFTAK